ncbi:MAG: adenylate/guanylate cyclase domain-containing protein [Ignavibacterium sp.]|nr:adenylate/guanylate cyclase domain-containing protein [Ignavibacterium sp.]
MRRQRKVELLPQLVESIVSDTADVFLLFVDLCGSTLYKRKCIQQKQPDLTWIFRQLIFLQRAADLVKKYNGIIVKTIGDELFAYFEATTYPEEIIKCAIEIIQGFGNLKSFKDESKIEAKVSLDFGLTYNGSIDNLHKFDPIGSAVDRCARLNSIAKKNEIVFSEDFINAIENKMTLPKFKSKYGFKTRTEDLKGIGKIKCNFIVAK